MIACANMHFVGVGSFAGAPVRSVGAPVPLVGARLPGIAIAMLVLATVVRPAGAQRLGGDVGLGLQIGDPSGVTLQFYNPGSLSWDFLAAWDIEDFFFLNLHGLYYRGLGERNDVHLFYGPGAFIGVHDRGRDRDDDVIIGVSGTIGVGIMLEQFQIFGAVTPRLSLLPATDGDVGVGIGVRYYF